jgi:hypothetical protein
MLTAPAVVEEVVDVVAEERARQAQELGDGLLAAVAVEDLLHPLVVHELGVVNPGEAQNDLGRR